MEQSSFVQILHSRKFWALVIALVAIMAGYGTGGLDAWQAIQALVAALAAYSTGVAIEDAGFKAGANRPATPVYELPASPAAGPVSVPPNTAPLNTAGSSTPPNTAGPSAGSSMVTKVKRRPADPDTTLKETQNLASLPGSGVGPVSGESAEGPSVAPEGKVLRQQLSRPYPRVKWEG